jgi:hypothetical protein
MTTTFDIGDKVSFGVRQNWLGRGTPSIPRYTGTVLTHTPFTKIPTLWISCPEYSNNEIAFTQRKNGNWVRKGDKDDNYRGYSRVALHHSNKPTPRIGEN